MELRGLSQLRPYVFPSSELALTRFLYGSRKARTNAFCI